MKTPRAVNLVGLIGRAVSSPSAALLGRQALHFSVGVYTGTAIPTTNWVRFGQDLPNAPVRGLLSDATDDVLAVATQGRGVWSIPTVRASLQDQVDNTGILRIQGDPGVDDTVLLIANIVHPQNLDVVLNGTLTATVPLANIRRIVVIGATGSDTLIIDSSRGLLAVPDGIHFNAGPEDTDKLRLLGSADVFNVPTVDASKMGSTTRTSGGMTERVEYQELEDIVNDTTPPSPAPLTLIRDGLGAVAETLALALTDPSQFGSGLVPFDGSFGPGLNGAPVDLPVGESDSVVEGDGEGEAEAEDQGDDGGPGLLRRRDPGRTQFGHGPWGELEPRRP